MRFLLVSSLLLAATACGIDPAKVSTHPLYADDGARVESDAPIRFAVMGATRTLVPGASDKPGDGLIADLQTQDLDFVVLTGGFVRRSATSEWQGFSTRFRDSLDGPELSDSRARRPVIAMPSDLERLGDKKLTGFGAAFPGTGPDIGLNRVASWSHADVAVGGQTWRLVFLDSHEKALGSRWDEQLFWLPEVVGDEKVDHLLVFLTDPLVTLAEGVPLDRDDDPSELLGVVDQNSGLMKLVGVFQGGVATNEMILPTGAFGEAYIVAGNAGIPSPGLARDREATQAGFERIALEPAYDAALHAAFEQEVAGGKVPQKAVEAEAIGQYDGGVLPNQGYWVVSVNGKSLDVGFRRWNGESVADMYATRWTKHTGWAVPEAK